MNIIIWNVAEKALNDLNCRSLIEKGNLLYTILAGN